MFRNLSRWVFVPIIFLLIAIFLSIIFFFNSDINPNVLSHNETDQNITQNNGIISGKFRATENYLGIISVRFAKNNINEDSIFRIKNTLDDDWYHTATISAVQYNTLPFYSFGFPVIENSKDKIYQFEIKLLSGDKKLSLSKTRPLMVSDYAFPKEILIKNPRLLFGFFQKKITYYLYTENSWKVFLIYSLPLLFYLSYILYFSRFVNKKYGYRFKKILDSLSKPFILLTISAILIDIFIIRKYSDTTTTILSLSWIISAITYKFEERYSFGVALVFLTFCPFLLSANMDWIAEKSAVWAYMMLVVGTIQAVFGISPGLQKIVKTKLFQIIIKFIKFIFLTLDHLIINLIIFIKQSIASSLTFIFKKFPTTFSGWLIFIGKSILLITGIFIILVTSTFTIIKINNMIQIINHKRIRLSLNPIIKTVEPTLAYKATKIVIYGKEFGDKYYKGFRLLMDKQVVQTDYKDNNKIIFSVPLHWKIGTHNILIEKDIDWDGKKITAKSEVFEIKILPITGGYTEEDDLYFKQMKTWKKETRELNGYK